MRETLKVRPVPLIFMVTEPKNACLTSAFRPEASVGTLAGVLSESNCRQCWPFSSSTTTPPDCIFLMLAAGRLAPNSSCTETGWLPSSDTDLVGVPSTNHGRLNSCNSMRPGLTFCRLRAWSQVKNTVLRQRVKINYLTP